MNGSVTAMTVLESVHPLGYGQLVSPANMDQDFSLVVTSATGACVLAEVDTTAEGRVCVLEKADGGVCVCVGGGGHTGVIILSLSIRVMRVCVRGV